MSGDGITTEPSPGPMRSRGVTWALRLSAVVLLAGLAATQYLSRLSGHYAQVARAPLTDPTTTGSIASSARGTVLDPCTGSILRR